MAKATEENNLFQQLAAEARLALNSDTPVAQLSQVYQLWWRWADFSLYIVSPIIEEKNPPQILPPELIPGTDTYEFVYLIHDYGFKLVTSKAEDMYTAGMSMCKMYYTIEKMIYLLIERLKSGGIDGETEVQIAFSGHELPQRKAFEVTINLPYNVVVTNFDPGAWGESYLEKVKRQAEKGYGYPLEAPRDNFRQAHGITSGSKIKAR